MKVDGGERRLTEVSQVTAVEDPFAAAVAACLCQWRQADGAEVMEVTVVETLWPLPLLLSVLVQAG